MDRERYPRRGGGFRVADYQWENPMPDISAADAKMWLALKGWGVRFHYRLPVVGWTNPPVFLRTLLPDWAPEFYLPFQRTVIVILGDFFGTIPAVIDATALGKAILEQAGWKVRVINEFELNYKGAGKILAEMHVTAGGANAGRVLHNPYGVPDTMAKFRRMRETSMRYLSTNVRV